MKYLRYYLLGIFFILFLLNELNLVGIIFFIVLIVYNFKDKIKKIINKFI